MSTQIEETIVQIALSFSNITLEMEPVPAEKNRNSSEPECCGFSLTQFSNKNLTFPVIKPINIAQEGQRTLHALLLSNLTWQVWLLVPSTQSSFVTKFSSHTLALFCLSSRFS